MLFRSKIMGDGIKIAALDNPEHAAVMENFKDQLLIVFLKRLGGKITIPVKEADDTGSDMLALNITDGNFNFEIKKKN